MLERATACLDSGARLSVRCTKRAPRSRRQLHSAFWNHGAGDLDLPPWAIPSQAPKDLPLSHGDRSGRCGGEVSSADAANKAPAVDTPFLDFLYPPQALAWLHRSTSGGQQRERWEKRNARRLPEGFIQASRGYASSSYAHAAVARKSRKEEEGEVVQEDAGFVELNSYERRQLAKRRGLERTTGDHVQDNVGLDEDKERAEASNSGAGNDSLDTLEARDGPEATRRGIRGARTEGSENAGLRALEFAANVRSRTREEPATIQEGGHTDETYYDDYSDIIGASLADADPLPSIETTEDYSQTEESQMASEDVKTDLDEGDAPSNFTFETTKELYDQCVILRRSGGWQLRRERDRYAREAWRKYQSLPEEQREDLAFKCEMLELLTEVHSKVALQNYLTILASVESRQWSLPFLTTACSTSIRRKRFREALSFHERAMSTISTQDAMELTRFLLNTFVADKQWDYAHEVFQQCDALIGGGTENIQTSLFHRDDGIYGLAKLPTHASSLIRHILRQEQSKVDRESRFCILVFTTTLTRLATTGELNMNNELPMEYFRPMLQFVREYDTSAKVTFDRLLSQLCHTEFGALQEPKFHLLTSCAFQNYVKVEDAMPSEDLLLPLLQRFLKYENDLVIDRNSQDVVTAEGLVEVWERYHGTLSSEAVTSLLSHYARQGDVEAVDRWRQYLRDKIPGFRQNQRALRSLIYVHARRGDVEAAKKAFLQVKFWCAEQGQEPDTACWNAILHAHARADDPTGAIETLIELIETTGLEPDERSFQPVMELLAKRGDVEGVQTVLGEFDQLSTRVRSTALINSLLNAHINVGDIAKAEDILRQSLEAVRSQKLLGSLTISFNIVITAHATRRDITAAMETYRWMQAEGVNMNADTYAALIQALAHFRQTDSAFKILHKVMPSRGLRPTGLHYAIVVAGYTNQGDFSAPRMAYIQKHMQENQVAPTIATEVAFQKAEALRLQKRSRRRAKEDGDAAPLEKVIRDLEDAQANGELAGIHTLRKPMPGRLVPDTAGTALSARYDFLVMLHGQRRCSEAVTYLFSKYRAQASEAGLGAESVPIRMLVALMAAYVKSGQPEEVERCWKMAKEAADDLTKPLAIPASSYTDRGDRVDSFGMSTVQAQAEDMAVEPAFSEQAQPVEKPVVGRQFILSQPLRHLIAAKAQQSRLPEAISTVSTLLVQGYTLDNRTWNAFIETLCRAQPPLALLAFVLTERFLIPHWPGWRLNTGSLYPQPKSAVHENLQHIRARYLRPAQLMPHYRLMVHLGRAFLQLRDIDAGRAGGRGEEGLEQYTGTLRQVRARAPKTLFAVQNMPRMRDELQERLLRRQSLRQWS